MKRPFTNVLVSLGGGGRIAAVRYAARLAAVSGAAITIIEVIDEVHAIVRPVVPGRWDVPTLARNQALAGLKRAADEARRAGSDPETILRVGTPVQTLVRAVVQGRYDLLVIDAPTRRPRRPGATAARLVRECPCPVLVVHSSWRPRRLRVLVAIDIGRGQGVARDAINAKLFEAALWFVGAERGQLHVLHVWEADGAGFVRQGGASDAEVRRYVADVRRQRDRELQRAVARIRARVPAARRHLVRGDPREVIPAFAHTRGFDIVVMGTVARKGLARWIIGNTAEALLGKVPFSLLVVRPRS